MPTLAEAILALAPVRNTIWRTESGPPLAAACLHYSQTPAEKGAALPAMAVAGFRRIIAERSPGGWVAADGNISAMFFACNLAQALLVLRKTQNLAPTEDASWTAALVSIAQRLVDTGEIRWYANGNLAIGNALVMALTHKVTGDPIWKRRYEEAWEHGLRPNPQTHPGRGLKVTNMWAALDQHIGYLTEEGSGGVGFDTDYTVHQSGLAARLWLLTGDWRAEHLTRLLWRKLSPLVDNQCRIDMTTGTRHPHPGQRWDLTSCSVAQLNRAGATDTDRLIATYWASILNPDRYPTSITAGPLYQIGMDLGTALLARSNFAA